jgi:hypothetical protein
MLELFDLQLLPETVKNRCPLLLVKPVVVEAARSSHVQPGELHAMRATPAAGSARVVHLEAIEVTAEARPSRKWGAAFISSR